MITLKDLERRPAKAKDWASPKWTPNDVEGGLWQALYDMVNNGFYAPYVERYPVALQDEFSEATKNAIEDNDTFACTEGERVYFDTERASVQFNEMMDRFGETEMVAVECKAVLSHEYTHILCEHHAIGEAIRRKYGKRVPQAVVTCHMIACEIQANRGSGVDKRSHTYQAGVTEDKFPETKGKITYSEIFAALLRSYNQKRKEMEEFAKMIKDLFGDQLAEEAKKQQGQGKGKDKGKKSEEDGDKGQGQGQDGTPMPKTEDAEEHFLSEEEIDNILEEAQDAEQEVYQELQEFGGGYGLDQINDNELEIVPDHKLSVEHKRWDERRIKEEIKRMKGYVRGSFSRNNEASYSRPSRRNIDPTSKLLKKGVRKAKTLMPKVLVAMDSSGSMGGTPVTTVATAIGNLFKDLGRPTEGCYIVEHTHECSKPQPLSKWEEVVKGFRPSGGNCFNNVVKLANELNVDVVFNIGDGCDCCVRSSEDRMDKQCQEFKAAGRKWVDTLILDKKENGYFDSEWEYDKNRGFEREVLQLGRKIGEYL